MRYTVRPLSDRTWLRPPARRTRSPFDSSWTSTLELLAREVEFLGGKNVVIELGIEERHLKLNGEVRANARPDTPAVVVAFEARDRGPMLFRCDRYESSYKRDSIAWQENVRAIALTLQALRAVDRYGATETGQQYAGFKALPAGGGRAPVPSSRMTSDQAVAALAAAAGVPERDVRADLPRIVRLARSISHPDRNGNDRAAWDRVEQAATVLGVGR